MSDRSAGSLPAVAGEPQSAPPPRGEERGGSTHAVPWWRNSERWALLAFSAYVAVAAIFTLFRPAAQQSWFWWDEWAVFAEFDSLGKAFDGHNGHWITVWWLVQYALYQLVGLTAYLPYLAVAVACHVAVVVLLRVTMRRHGVDAWTATVMASVLMLFTPGAHNITVMFQMQLTGALALGLGALLLADHEGGIGWRDALSALLLLLAVMSSGIGLVMVFVTGLALLLQRGWRTAAALVVLPLLAYGAWRLLAPTNTLGGQVEWSGLPRWLVSTGDVMISGLAPVAGLGVGVALVLGAGLTLAWARTPRPGVRTWAVPVALATGAFALSFSVFLSRSFLADPTGMAAERYLYVLVALFLPLAALGFSAITTASRWGFVILALPLATILVNAATFRPSPGPVLGADQEKVVLLAAARSPVTADLPGWVRPSFEVQGALPITLDWLRTAAAEGRLPPVAPRERDPATEASLRLRAGLAPAPQPVVTDSRCVAVSSQHPARLHLRAGDRVDLSGDSVPVLFRLIEDGQVTATRRVPLMYGNPVQLSTTLPDLVVDVEPEPLAPATPSQIEVCAPAQALA